MSELTIETRQRIMNVDDQQATLPQTYTNAVNAIQECATADECMEWKNKAQAMASYARQAKDDTLLQQAQRINTRAWRRAGLLLQQIEPQQGANNRYEVERDSTVPNYTRTQAATDAGMSERERKTALRIANVDDGEFERQVESNNPPTATALSKQGTKPAVNLEGIDPETFKQATKVKGMLGRFDEMTNEIDPTQVAVGFKSFEIDRLKSQVHAIDAWLDKFITSLPE